MARYIKITGGTGFCGCDFEEYLVFDDSICNEAIDEVAWDIANGNAESYEDIERDYCIDEDEYDDYDDYETAVNEAREMYYADVECSWKEITKEEYEENARR